MKHGIRFWQKKLNRTPTHRASLLSNLLAQLVEHEQIQTTVAKAKFLAHEMDAVIQLLIQGYQSIKERRLGSSEQENEFPKLKHVLASRYLSQSGGYTRILKNGYRASGSDRAALAIVELVNNPNDIIYHMAERHGSLTQKDLATLETKKYSKKVLVLHNLQTGEAQNMVKLGQRSDLQHLERKKLVRVERAIHKKIVRFNKSLQNFSEARLVDDESKVKLESSNTEIAPKFFLVGKYGVGIAPVVEDAVVVEGKSESSAGTTTISEEVESIIEEKPVVKEAPKSFLQKLFGRGFR